MSWTSTGIEFHEVLATGWFWLQPMSDIIGPSETTTGATTFFVVNFYPGVITASVFATFADADSEIQSKFSPNLERMGWNLNEALLWWVLVGGLTVVWIMDLVIFGFHGLWVGSGWMDFIGLGFHGWLGWWVRWMGLICLSFSWVGGLNEWI